MSFLIMSLEGNKDQLGFRLSESAERILRRENVLSVVGRELKKDLRENPWKLSPLLAPFPTGGVCYALAGSMVLGTLLFKNITDPDFRQKVKDAREQPLIPKLYEDHLVQCAVTGEYNADNGAVIRTRLGKVKAHTHHLIGLQIERVPEKLGQRTIKRLHHKVANIKLPVLVEAAKNVVAEFDEMQPKHQSGSAKKWLGPVFALACLSTLDPGVITEELYGRDRELYLEDIEKDHTSLILE